MVGRPAKARKIRGWSRKENQTGDHNKATMHCDLAVDPPRPASEKIASGKLNSPASHLHTQIL